MKRIRLPICFSCLAATITVSISNWRLRAPKKHTRNSRSSFRIPQDSQKRSAASVAASVGVKEEYVKGKERSREVADRLAFANPHCMNAGVTPTIAVARAQDALADE